MNGDYKMNKEELIKMKKHLKKYSENMLDEMHDGKNIKNYNVIIKFDNVEYVFPLNADLHCNIDRIIDEEIKEC